MVFAEVDGRLTTPVVAGQLATLIAEGRLVVDGKGGRFATAGNGRLLTAPGLSMVSLSTWSLKIGLPIS